ncbi:MAG: hypothetical protein HGA16_00055 [Candidatus Moranbacteria bacterium]|nr:hypothetical protein [Candidatus Moranbacteria bacterium]
MKRTRRSVWYCLLLLVLLAADAKAGGSETLRDFRQAGSAQPSERKEDFKPLAFAGVALTGEIKAGNFTCFSWNFPETPEALAEWDPLRVSYQAHVVGADGKEYVSHALFAGIAGSYPAPRYAGVVEGITSARPDLKGVTLSTKLQKAYTLSGVEIREFDPEKWADGEYRRAFVLRYGTPLSDTPVTDLVKSEIAHWNVYQTTIGLVASPWDESQVRKLAEMNPRYSFFGKLVDVGNFRVSLSMIATASGAALDVLSAIGAKSTGFDYKSQQSRIDQGYNLLVWNQLYAVYFSRKGNQIKQGG